ncbi:MAG: hypothetical protein AAFQ82_08445 [Myxococcota bacterium]
MKYHLDFDRRSSCYSSLIACLVALAAMVAPSFAQASPWVLPKGKSVLSIKGGTDFASREFLIDDRREQRFPLRGRFESYSLQLAGRYGLFEDVEIGTRVTLKNVAYISDPVILASPDDATNPCTPDNATFQGCRERNTNFSSSDFGFSDIYFNLVMQHIGGSARAASNLEIKVPTGYTEPGETFQDGEVDPLSIVDDVALGDGRVHLQYKLETGWFISSSGTVLELAGGYRARLGAPGDQVLGEVKIGQNIGRRLFFFISADAALTIFEGRVLGQTFVSNRPNTPALEFTGDDVERRDFRLDNSFARATAGVIVRLNGREVVISASQIFAGENIPRLTSINFGAILPFQ